MSWNVACLPMSLCWVFVIHVEQSLTELLLHPLFPLLLPWLPLFEYCCETNSVVRITETVRPASLGKSRDSPGCPYQSKGSPPIASPLYLNLCQPLLQWQIGSSKHCEQGRTFKAMLQPWVMIKLPNRHLQKKLWQQWSQWSVLLQRKKLMLITWCHFVRCCLSRTN